MNASNHRYALELFDVRKKPLGQFPVEPPDLHPARQNLSLATLRDTGAPPAPELRTIVEPEWSEAGEPHLGVLQITLGALSLSLGWEIFRPAAEALSGQLVADGRLAEGEVFHYRPLAFRQPAPPRRAIISEAEEADPLAAVRERSFDGLFARGTEQDAAFADPQDFAVFIPAGVLAEFERQTRAAVGVETGGVLIGHLLRDPVRCALAIEVTALIAAQHTAAKNVALKFTAETWNAMQAAIALRRSAEHAVGWAHSHPVYAFDFCKDCPPEKRAVCSLRKPFLSRDDLSLHRVVFPAAFNVALLASHDVDVEFALYGWRRGVVQRRGFHLLETTT